MLVHKFLDVRGRLMLEVFVYKFSNHIEYKVINSLNDDICNVIKINCFSFMNNFSNAELEKKYLSYSS